MAVINFPFLWKYQPGTCYDLNDVDPVIRKFVYVGVNLSEVTVARKEHRTHLPARLAGRRCRGDKRTALYYRSRITGPSRDRCESKLSRKRLSQILFDLRFHVLHIV